MKNKKITLIALIFIILVCLSLLLLPSEKNIKSNIELAKISKINIDDKSEIYYVQSNDNEYISMNILWKNRGLVNQDIDKYMLPIIVPHVIEQDGTSLTRAPVIELKYRNLNANVFPFVHDKYFGVNISAPTQNITKTIDIVKEIIQFYRVREQSLENVKENIISSQKQEENDPLSNLWRMYNLTLGEDSKYYPFAFFELGKGLDFNSNDVKEFISNLTADNIIFIFSGPISKIEAQKTANNFMEILPKPTNGILNQQVSDSDNIKVPSFKIGYKNDKVKQAYITSSMPYADKNNIETFIYAQIVNNLLSDFNISPIYRILRTEKGIAYSPTIDTTDMGDIKRRILSIEIEPKNIEETLMVLSDIFAKDFFSVFTKEDLQVTIDEISRSFADASYYSDVMVDFASEIVIEGYSLQQLEELAKSIQEINPEEIADYWQKYMDINKAQFIIMSPYFDNEDIYNCIITSAEGAAKCMEDLSIEQSL